MILDMRQICERQLLHKGAKFDFERLVLSTSDGRTISREVVRHPGAVVILPILHKPDGPRVVMIRNDRFAVGRELWELPAGTLEPPEAPDRCAARELEEETGFRAGSIVPLATFYTTPGMTDELMHAFLATDLTPVPQRLEEDERIQVVQVSPSEAFGLLDRNELLDAKSMLTLLIAQRRKLLPS